MRFKTISKILLGVTPAAILPIALTSCSVYTDMLKDFKPDYEALSSQPLTKDQAANIFFEKARSQKDFGIQENYWAHHRAALQKDFGTVEGVEQLIYTSEFSNYYIHFSYFDINSDTHKISYKINTDIEEQIKYHYEDAGESWDSTGVNHYKVEWECKNLEFNVVKFDEEVGGVKSTLCLVKPKIYISESDTWERVLKDDEQINFNVRYIVEAYNKDGLQRYAYEASEAAVMDKTRSFESELKHLLDYFCCFYSYYLSNCTITD